MLIAFTLSHEWAEAVRFGVAVLIPILVGIVAKSGASSSLKVLVNTVLAALTTLLTALVDTANVDVAHLVVNFITTSAVAGAMYLHIWLPTGVADAVADKTAGFGIGQTAPPPPRKAVRKTTKGG